ncbi:MAG: outer membrane beta-barrel protein [Steroidobacteraceae bacterium]
MKLKTAMFASLVLVAGTAAAADDGFYVGAGVGYGKININSRKIDNAIDGALLDPPTGYSVTQSSVGQGATPYSLTAGYRFMKYLAVEVSYIDLGNADYKATVSDGLDTGGRVKAQWEATGWPVSVLGIWPIDDSWEVFGRVGLFMGDVKLNAKAVDGAGDPLLKGHTSANSNEFLGGVGANFNFLDKWTARLEWQALPSLGNNKTGDGNWNNIQASIFYRF